jgi:hypothetical protein
MENISFVLWMVLFPLSITLSEYLKASITRVWNIKSDPGTGLIILIIWIGVGILLYRK